MRDVVRIAAVGDIHCSRTSQGSLHELFEWTATRADVLLLCGDLTDYGMPEEGKILLEELAVLGSLPKLAVLGNHDFECARHDELTHVLVEGGIIVLDGESCEVAGIGFAGVKGFAGGFGEWALQSWGEEPIKRFVHAGVEEAVKLEAALTHLTTEHRIVLMHYAPIRETVEGEPPEIFPFLGSSRLEEPISRYPVTLVFHGHAHRGQLEGATRTGVPVYNVSMPLLTRVFSDRPPFRVFDVPLGEAESGQPTPAPSRGRRATDAIAS
jgi:Icc-related predicted phosphoesterase